MQEILKPMDIEKRSFEIISQEIGSVDLNEKELLVLMLLSLFLLDCF